MICEGNTEASLELHDINKKERLKKKKKNALGKSKSAHARLLRVKEED